VKIEEGSGQKQITMQKPGMHHRIAVEKEALHRQVKVEEQTVHGQTIVEKSAVHPPIKTKEPAGYGRITTEEPDIQDEHIEIEDLPGQRSYETEEHKLVEKARAGDQDAFGELVRRHRAKAVGWANAMTRDAYLAEDIVQDALIRAFLQIGTLMDNKRFRPWLKKIIYNQGLMRLRRGGPYAKERPFAHFTTADERSSGVNNNWRVLDYVLYRLSAVSAERAKEHHDPETYVMKQETLAYIRRLVYMLNQREREIFEAYFFQEYNPQEIALMLQTSTATVYNYISRSRKKLQKERIRLHLRAYVQDRKAQGRPVKKILPPPAIF
jgi:RNA polymerase sigma factor (sigma-70 family)